MLSKNIALRSSIRKFKPDGVVTQSQIDLMLEAAMLAPSAHNGRPWEFWVITNREKLTELAEAHRYAQMLRTAQLAIIICAEPHHGITGSFFPQDCGAATENLMLQAVEMGLGSCWCGVYPREELIGKMREIIELPEALVPFNLIAVGVPDEAPERRGYYEAGKVHYIR